MAALEYTFGAGVSRLYYHQANDAYEYWLWRPELSLAYPFLEKFKLRYYLRMYQNPPRLEYLGDVDVRNNELEVSRGNSALFLHVYWSSRLPCRANCPRFMQK